MHFRRAFGDRLSRGTGDSTRPKLGTDSLENPLETLGGLVTNLPVTESLFFRGYESGDACGICQDDLANGQEICVNRNCQHGFHCNCINDWFNGPTHPPRLCPACRQTWVNEKLPDAQQQIIQNMGFGKKKKSSEIKYLQCLC